MEKGEKKRRVKGEKGEEKNKEKGQRKGGKEQEGDEEGRERNMTYLVFDGHSHPHILKKKVIFR